MHIKLFNIKLNYKRSVKLITTTTTIQDKDDAAKLKKQINELNKQMEMYKQICDVEDEQASENIWKFVNENGKNEQCYSQIIETLNKLSIGNNTDYKIGPWKYIATKLNDDSIEQINTQTKTKRTLKRFTITSNKQMSLVTELFHKTMSSTTYEICKIEDLKEKYKDLKEYKAIEKIYARILNEKKVQLGKNCEKLLFHGTQLETFDKIAKNGFNRDYNSRSYYGKVCID